MSDTMKRIALAARPVGEPKPSDFKFEDAEMPSPGEGEFLARTIWLSLDPYMRGRMDDSKSYAKPVPLGGTMEGGTVSEVIESKHPDYKPGDIVVGRMGWATHGVSDGVGYRKVDPSIAPISTALGVLGMPGQTAFVGLNDIGEAKEGETLVVSAATGAVGSLVCQLGKLKGMKVIGVAGGADKCAWAMENLGIDACLDHRAASDAAALGKQLREAAPQGVDVYFENVGGKTLKAVIGNLNQFSRIAICGMISWYSGAGEGNAADDLPKVWRALLVNKCKAQGFIVSDHMHRLPDFLGEVGPLVRDGKITFRESVEEGLENAPDAFLRLLKGGNFGKQLVRVGADPA